MTYKVDIARAVCELQMLQKRASMVVAKEFALSPQQMNLMWYLSPDQPPAMSQVAEWMECDLASISGLVDKLEARRLVQRTRSEDKRVKLLQLTPEGQALREALMDRLQEAPEWLAALNQSEQQQFARLLLKCLDASRTRPGLTPMAECCRPPA